MKEYEFVFDSSLPKRLPIIIRLDGRAFHTLTRKMALAKPFDVTFRNIMAQIAIKLCREITGAKLAYLQSDEISILVINYESLETECWFDNRIQKICSVTSSIASSMFTKLSGFDCSFDSRIAVYPPNEVCNYFIFRQQDATRNSINSLAQSLFPCKQLNGLNVNDVMDMLFKEKGINWNAQPTQFRRGSCVWKSPVDGKWIEDKEISIFTQDRMFINRFIPELNGTL